MIRKLGGIIAVSGMLIGPTALAEVDVYGKIHLSADNVDMGGDKEDATLSNNSSRIGFKGSVPLDYGMKANWLLESSIDATGESGTLGARNRYLALETGGMGTAVLGIHDTPHKSFGKKFDLMADTIGDRRSILGAGALSGSKFDTRGKNSAMYISPKMAGLQLRVMGSAGQETGADGTDALPLTSASLVWDSNGMYFGVSWEDQDSLDASDMRIGFGAAMGGLKANVIYEQMKSSKKKEYDRPAYGLSVEQKLGKSAIQLQWLMADDFDGTDKSAGQMIAAAFKHPLGKSLTSYVMVAQSSNDDNAAFGIARKGHGDDYAPSANGEDVLGVSLGLSLVF